MFFKIEMLFFPCVLLLSMVRNECVAAHNSVPPDPTMTVDNVTQILSKVPGYRWERVMDRGRLDIPGPLLEEIQRRYSTDTEKNHAHADYYVNYHPKAEWEHLTTKLYFYSVFTAARESKSFLSTGKSHNCGGNPSPMHKIVAIGTAVLGTDEFER